MSQDIVFTVDYHDQNLLVRRLDRRTGKEQVLKCATQAEVIERLLDRAVAEAKRRGAQVVWIQESTTGWARMSQLLQPQVKFELANVVQMPLPPKGRRRKTDKIDTARLQREYLNGELPRAYQPLAEERQLRRLVGLREDLSSRRTALRNWINRYLAHETWFERSNLWSSKGRRRLQGILTCLPSRDRWIIEQKLQEHDLLQSQLNQVGAELVQVQKGSEAAQRLDAIRGIGTVAAVSIMARIGDIERFAKAEELIGYAGLAPGVRQSDGTRRDGGLGGGGSDRHLRHYLLEASIWARHLPRYREHYQRVLQRRGPKVGRLAVARLLLRSIYKMLKEGVAFTPGAEPACV